jgi:hypothetical protein
MKAANLLLLLLLVVPTQAAERYSKDVPNVTVQLPKVTSIILDARNVAAGRTASESSAPNPDATRQTTNHHETLQINVGNLGPVPAVVTVRWFWVGRYVTSGNWFRAGEGEKLLTIDPKKSEIVLAENGDSESHVTKAAHEHYKSGGNMLGWIVTVANRQGEIQAVKASEPNLQGFAVAVPPKKRK